jgi:hypothetical protein
MIAEGDDRFEPKCGMAQRYNRVSSVRDEWRWITASPDVGCQWL